MNPIRLLVFGATLLALSVAAQQSSSTPQQPSPAGVAHEHGMPTAEAHLKVLAEKLNLTAEQQVKAKPIMQEMHDAQEKLALNESLSHEERMTRQRPIFEKADKQLREILTDEQKTKLDQIEQEQHSHSQTPENPN